MKRLIGSSVRAALLWLGALSLFVHDARAADCQTALKPTDDYKVLSSTLKCMVDQIAALRKELDALKGAPGPAPGIGALPARAKPTARASSGICKVDLMGCARRASTIACEVVVTSVGKDGSFYFHPEGTSVFDNLGREFKTAQIFFLGKNVGHQKQITIADVPIAGRIEFDRVDASSAAISSLRHYVVGTDNGDRIAFRNVTLKAE